MGEVPLYPAQVGISDGSGTELILSTPERMLVQVTFLPRPGDCLASFR